MVSATRRLLRKLRLRLYGVERPAARNEKRGLQSNEYRPRLGGSARKTSASNVERHVEGLLRILIVVLALRNMARVPGAGGFPAVARKYVRRRPIVAWLNASRTVSLRRRARRLFRLLLPLAFLQLLRSYPWIVDPGNWSCHWRVLLAPSLTATPSGNVRPPGLGFSNHPQDLPLCPLWLSL